MQALRAQKTERKTRNAKLDEPMAEGVVPLKSNGQRDWKSLSDSGLTDFAKRLMTEKMMSKRIELIGADHGLYEVLRRRKLLKAAFSGIESSEHKEAVDGVLDALGSFGTTSDR